MRWIAERIFDYIDTGGGKSKGDGEITVEELKADQKLLTKEDIDDILNAGPDLTNNSISKNDFIARYINMRQRKPQLAL